MVVRNGFLHRQRVQIQASVQWLQMQHLTHRSSHYSELHARPGFQKVMMPHTSRGRISRLIHQTMTLSAFLLPIYRGL